MSSMHVGELAHVASRRRPPELLTNAVHGAPSASYVGGVACEGA